jgi:hypothetical protein
MWVQRRRKSRRGLTGSRPQQCGAATVIVFVSNAGVLSSKLPLAANDHVFAGQKEEAQLDNC